MGDGRSCNSYGALEREREESYIYNPGSCQRERMKSGWMCVYTHTHSWYRSEVEANGRESTMATMGGV